MLHQATVTIFARPMQHRLAANTRLLVEEISQPGIACSLRLIFGEHLSKKGYGAPFGAQCESFNSVLSEVGLPQLGTVNESVTPIDGLGFLRAICDVP